MRGRKDILRGVLLACGIFLLYVNLYGVAAFKPLEPEKHELPGYDYPLRDIAELEEAAASPPEIETLHDLEEINALVFETIFHTDSRKYSLSENYLLYFGGFIHEYISSPQYPQSIIRGGGGLCSEISAVLKHILGEADVTARFIGLQGHVVLEVELDEKRVVADPDYGIVYEYPLEELEERGEEIIPPLLEEVGYPGDMVEPVVEVFTDSEGNVVLREGEHLSGRLYIIERTAGFLKWLIPAGFLLLGGKGLKRPGDRGYSRIRR